MRANASVCTTRLKLLQFLVSMSIVFGEVQAQDLHALLLRLLRILRLLQLSQI